LRYDRLNKYKQKDQLLLVGVNLLVVCYTLYMNKIDKEKKKEYNINYINKNKDSIKEYRRLQSRKYLEKNRERILFRKRELNKLSNKNKENCR